MRSSAWLTRTECPGQGWHCYSGLDLGARAAWAARARRTCGSTIYDLLWMGGALVADLTWCPRTRGFYRFSFCHYPYCLRDNA